MQDLNFNPYKSTSDFRKNYKLHDLAETAGKNLLTQWGFEFHDFGKDNRYKKVWEKGKDKPDIIISYKNKKALLDWKAKHKSKWLINERAYNSYKEWEKILLLPVIISFFVFDEKKEIADMRFACLSSHKHKASSEKEWDKNQTIEFENALPLFSKPALIKFLA
jgi:hypothetical protein